MSRRNGGADPLPRAPDGSPVRIGRIELDDVDALAGATRQARVELHQAEPGRYRGGALDLELGDAGIQWGHHGLAIVVRGEVVPEGAFLAAWNGAPARASGRDLRGLAYYPPAAEFQGQTRGAMSWVSIRVSGLGDLARAIAPGLDLSAAGGVRHAERGRKALALLRGLLVEARRLAEAGAGTLADPAARHGLRELLGAAVVRVLAAERPERVREGLEDASALVRRAEEILRAREFQPTYVPELCAAAGASEARLRSAFLKVYGIGPARYLRLRRLHLVRRALRSSRPGELTVSAAAARYGFFEFGRFAGDYRAMFGELPSRTRRAR